ncbi:hypothetical protein BOTNAR_0482g00080 [Botryotinia narcissicola]|uniref:Uncharacterized protein n=1 Tax=Botryotinia narcissicola TaxID=278944 RepID=A0A4Z1HHD1_9HELO|nr:hypothetical protein BOTNAR_0482g00080 [Botryotinia narcissicola]
MPNETYDGAALKLRFFSMIDAQSVGLNQNFMKYWGTSDMGVIVVDGWHMESGSIPLLAATTNIITSRNFPYPHNKQNKATRKPDVESPDFLEQLFARLRLWWSGLVAV